MTTDISKWKRGMNVLVLCALVGFWVAPYFDSNLDAEIKAPLFAVVAATALCIRGNAEKRAAKRQRHSVNARRHCA